MHDEIESSRVKACERRHLVEDEARLQHLLEMKRSFVRYVSHEIRTPLSIVTMGLKLLEENFASSLPTTTATTSSTNTAQTTSTSTTTAHTPSTDTASATSTTNTTAAAAATATVGIVDTTAILELIRDMRDSSVTAVNTLNDLLLYEKIESNMLTIEPATVCLHDLTSKAIKMFKIQVYRLYFLLYTISV